MISFGANTRVYLAAGATDMELCSKLVYGEIEEGGVPC